MAHRGLVVLAGLAAIALFVVDTTARASAFTPLEFALEMDGGIVMPVRIGGRGPFTFRLDTGAGRTVVSDRLAAALGLPAAGASVLVTHTGTTRHNLVTLGPVELGCGEARPVQALVLPGATLDPGRRIDGLIGQDVLAGLTYTLDYRRRRLECHADAPPVRGAGSLPLAFSGAAALVSVPLSDGSVLRLVPDTGADRLVLFNRADGGGPLVTPLGTMLVRSLAGQRLARRVLVQGLRLGGGSPRSIEGLLVDAAPDLMGDGLLPLHLFERVTFNGPGGWLTIESRR